MYSKKRGISWSFSTYTFSTPLVPGVIAFNMLRMLPIAVIWRLNVKQTMICALVRALFRVFSARQAQSFTPSTLEIYGTILKELADANTDAGLAKLLSEQSIQDLKTDQPSSLIWLGNRKKASKVVLFFHGGGFIMPAAPGHIRWAWDAYVLEGRRIGVDVACAMLQYSLAPDINSPNQLQQALAALQAVLDEGFSPRDIVIGGDSAGANLTMQVLLYLRHKSEASAVSDIVLPLVKLKEPLQGAFQISTFLSLEALNQKASGPVVEMFSTGTVQGMADALLPFGGNDAAHTKAQQAICPLDGDLACFDDLDQTVRNIYVSFGEYELFADQNIKLIEVLKSRCKRINVVSQLESKGAHDIMSMEYFFPGDAGGPAAAAKKKWLRSLWTE